MHQIKGLKGEGKKGKNGSSTSSDDNPELGSVKRKKNKKSELSDIQSPAEGQKTAGNLGVPSEVENEADGSQASHESDFENEGQDEENEDCSILGHGELTSEQVDYLNSYNLHRDQWKLIEKTDGLGVKALLSLALDAQGEYERLVGVEDELSILRDTQPFAPGDSKKQRQEAARLVATYRRTEGCDAVLYAAPVKDDAPAKEYHISWEAGSAVPLAVLTIQQMAECGLCMDQFSNAEGFTCADSKRKKCTQFTCWDCLLRSYEMASRPGAIHGNSNLQGDLLCANVKCRCPIAVDHLARGGATKEVLDAKEAFKVQIVVEQKTAEAVKQEQARVQQEYARIEAIKDNDEKDAAKLRLKLINEVLTLRCPNCKTAFLDFSGCFALTCGNNNCRHGFCAWCLKDCGHDAHPHVMRCKENQGVDLFNTQAVFDEHHRKKRTIAIKAAIQSAGLNPSALTKLRNMLQRELADLRIPINEVFPADMAGAAAPAAPARAAPAAAAQRGVVGALAAFFNQYDDYELD